MDRQKLQHFIPVKLPYKNATQAQSSPVMHSWKPWNHVDSNHTEKPDSNENAKKKVMNNRLSNSNSRTYIRDGNADAYPYINQPVVFNSGNGYGTGMFCDMMEELSDGNSCNLKCDTPWFCDGLRSDVYKLSSEEDMIEEFLKILNSSWFSLNARYC